MRERNERIKVIDGYIKNISSKICLSENVVRARSEKLLQKFCFSWFGCSRKKLTKEGKRYSLSLHIYCTIYSLSFPLHFYCVVYAVFCHCI